VVDPRIGDRGDDPYSLSLHPPSFALVGSPFSAEGEVCIFEDKSARRMVYMTQSTVLHVTSQNVHQSLKFFHQQSE